MAFSPSSSHKETHTTSPYPTTFVKADTSSFKQVVQMLTGSSKHHIPPIKSSPKKQPSNFRLYERRNSLKNNLKINPSGFSSPRKPDMLSPSVLDFPALVISPVTPLLQDPFGGSSAEDKAIKEKGFFLHPSPVTTPRGGDSPRLLPLFPTTSPRGGPSHSSDSCSDS